jgi:hypothetical protein
MENTQGMNNPLKIGATVSQGLKPTLYIVGGLAAIYASYKVYKLLFPGGLDMDPSKDPPTITDSQAITIAGRCYTAMASAGTDEQALFAALSGLKYNDYVKVSKAFGLKSYFYLTGEAPVFDWMGTNLNLEEWIIEELDLSEIEELSNILPEIF